MNIPNGKRVLLPSIPIRFSAYGIRKITSGVALGADTTAILKQLGYTEEDICELTRNGSVR